MKLCWRRKARLFECNVLCQHSKCCHSHVTITTGIAAASQLHLICLLGKFVLMKYCLATNVFYHFFHVTGSSVISGISTWFGKSVPTVDSMDATLL